MGSKPIVFPQLSKHFCLDLNVLPRTRPQLTLVFSGTDCSLLLENQTLESDYMAGPHTRLPQEPVGMVLSSALTCELLGKERNGFPNGKEVQQRMRAGM